MNILDLLKDLFNCALDVTISIALFLWSGVKYILFIDLIIILIGALLFLGVFIHHRIQK